MLHRRARRHFSAILSAHAIRQRKQPASVARFMRFARLHEPEVILVVAAYLPRIRELGELNVQH
jgi:hypothetical protein